MIASSRADGAQAILAAMGVLTVFYRVPRKMFDRIVADPEVFTPIIDGDADEPSNIGIDKLWEETRLLLSAAGHEDAAGVFDDANELETEDGVELQALSAEDVQKLAPLLAAIELDGVAKAAIESEDFDRFREKPWEAESAAKVLGSIVRFVREAAAAREAIVIATS